MKKDFRFLRGFTLVELLVVIFVMVIIATVAADVLMSVFRSSNRANILNEVNQNANFIFATIEATLRNGKSVFMNSGNLVIIDQYNQRNEFRVGNESVNYGGTSYTVGVVQKAVSAGPFFTITNNNPALGVNVVLGSTNFSVGSSNPPLVCVNLRLIQGPAAPGRIDYQTDRTFPPKCFELRRY